MAKSALKEITAKAKSICRQHPGTKWLSAIKQASAHYRKGKKVSGVKRHKATRRKKVSGVTASNTVRKDLAAKKQRLVHGYATTKRKRTTIGEVKRDGKKILDEKLGWFEVNKFHAKTKTAKRKIQRMINEVKKELRNFA